MATINDIKEIKIGHAQNLDAITGCTVILCEKGAVAGVAQSGGGPGTRETDAIRPGHFVENAHAILLSGGSAFGLAAADGVMRYLEEKKIGVNVGVTHVPIVPSAILFDLAIGDGMVRPDAEMGYEACLNATSETFESGSVGAGTGCSVGKPLGMGNAVKSGIGSACIEIGKGLFVAAVMAVNAFGDVIDPKNGEILAGTRSLNAGPVKIGEGLFADTRTVMKSMLGKTAVGFASRQNTVIGCVITNAVFSSDEMDRLAHMGHNGLVRSVRPANTMFDGDTLFALSVGNKKANLNIVGAFAEQAVQEAILDAVNSATALGGIPAVADLS